jgi:hypothetical protein
MIRGDAMLHVQLTLKRATAYAARWSRSSGHVH